MKIINKIKAIRKDKGISQEAMAMNLEISQAAYTKLERNETKLTVDRLYKIAEILGVKIESLLNLELESSQQGGNDEPVITLPLQQIENLYRENKEIYGKLIQSKDEQIALLQKLLENK
ncbi:MAG: helix-turn-helix transcriptional regulator [Flavobacteriaceae bacterium]|jgi:transcriptional regulator with XRE-family HTH domain|nr:helix-turn-helix transcriptional regulator [Flavobacteriaceae bacterium]